MTSVRLILIIGFIGSLTGCGKKSDAPSPPVTPVPVPLQVKTISINSKSGAAVYYDINFTPAIKIAFTTPVDRSTVAGNVSLATIVGNTTFTAGYESGDSVLIVQPVAALTPITQYTVRLLTGLQSKEHQSLVTA